MRSLPGDTHCSGAPVIRTFPVAATSLAVPRKRARWPRAAIASTEGQGGPAAQLPSISRAAMPVSLTRGPSLHHIGPSSSHSAFGVQAKLAPLGMMGTTAEIMSRGMNAAYRPLLNMQAKLAFVARDHRLCSQTGG